MKFFIASVFFVLLIIFSYFFIDSPLVFFIHANEINKQIVFKLLTHIPDIIIGFIVIYLIALPFCIRKEQSRQFINMMFIAIFSVVSSIQVKDFLKYVFGRFWPDTWINGNPSLLVNNAYGFHFFTSGSAYGSFPSGHTAVTFAFFSVCIRFYPKYKAYFYIPMVLLCVGQVFTHFHFLSDVIGGALVGFWVSKLICYYSSVIFYKNTKRPSTKVLTITHKL